MSSNPWTKKNPFMSMWLSTANKTMNSARGQVTAAAKRETARVQADATRQLIDLWTGNTAAPGKARKTRR